MIVVLSVLGLGGLIGLFYVSHTIEKQRRQKALMIANLSDYVFRMQRLLDIIPSAYLSNEIQTLVLGQIGRRVERLTQLTPGNDKFRKKQESLNAQIAELNNSATKAQAPTLKSPEEANEIRKVLQEMSKVIENFVQNKTISVAEGKKHLSHLQSSFMDANINYHIQVAQQAKQGNKLKLAILNYQKAIQELQKHNHQGNKQAKIDQLTNIIQELQIEAGQAPPTEEEHSSNELDQAMNELIEEEDAWKKKYF